MYENLAVRLEGNHRNSIMDWYVCWHTCLLYTYTRSHENHDLQPIGSARWLSPWNQTWLPKSHIWVQRDTCSKSLCLVPMIYVKFWGGVLIRLVVSNSLFFSPLLGEMIQFDYLIFSKWVETCETTNKLFVMISIAKAALPGDQVEQMGHVFPQLGPLSRGPRTERGRLAQHPEFWDKIMSHPRSMKIWCLPLSFRIRMFGDLIFLVGFVIVSKQLYSAIDDA